MRQIIIGVVGGTSEASDETLALASRVGEAIAQQGYILLTGVEPKKVKGQ